MAAPTTVTTRQKGVAVIIDNRPGITGYLNIDFPEQRKAREQNGLVGEFGQVVTELANDIVDEVAAKLVVTTGTVGSIVLPDVFTTLTETGVDLNTGAAARTWLVLERSRPRKAGNELLVDLKLKISEGVTLTS